MTTKPKYDVALSFMMPDIGLARRLYEALSPNLSVFFFEREQEEITGRHGDEVFRTPFLEARLTVVLYRAGYGERGWTGVERTAIGEACLANGYRNLFVVATEPSLQMPPWVPSTHIYFSTAAFSDEELIGAIKGKVLELGAQLQVMTPEKRAAQSMADQEFDRDKRRFYSNGLPIMEQEIARVFESFAAKIKALDNGATALYELAHNRGQFGVRDANVTLFVQWFREGYTNIDTDELRVEEYTARVELPNQTPYMWFGERPSPVAKSAYQLELARSGKHVWRQTKAPYGKTAASDLTSDALADRLVIEFYDLMDRANKDRNKRRDHF